MHHYRSWIVSLLCAAVLGGCGGGIEDKDGRSVKVGEAYVMTRKGLEHVPYFRDKTGSPLEVGKQYVMTAGGLELVPYLKDRTGRRVELGGEYLMTEEGLRLVHGRRIQGLVLDGAGKPLAGATVRIAGSEYSSATGGTGAFSLPFVEGYVHLEVDIPKLPSWCRIEKGASAVLSREAHPDGWDAGAVRVPCVLQGVKGDRAVWASGDGAFVDHGDGTVTDTRHGLMWQAEIAEHGVSWHKAVESCRNLGLGGYTDWRIPTRAELATLLEAGSACGWHGSPVIRGALTVWTAEQPDPDTAITLNMCSGAIRKAPVEEEGLGVSSSALAVRSVK